MLNEFREVHSDEQSEDTRRLLDRIRDFQIVFHIGEGYVKELDTTDEDIDAEEVKAAIKNRWKWEPVTEPLAEQQFSSLNDLGLQLGLGSAAETEQQPGASGDAAKGEDSSFEAIYRAAVVRFLTTRSLIASRDSTGDDKLFKLFHLFPADIKVVRYTVDKEVLQLKDVGAATPSDIESFIGASFLIQQIVVKAARVALWSWLRAHREQSTAFEGAFRALGGEDTSGWWLYYR